MDSPADFMGFGHFSTDMAAVFDHSTVSLLTVRLVLDIPRVRTLCLSYLFVSQSMLFPVASAPPNVQSQLPYTPFPEIPIGTHSTQVPYDTTQVQDQYLPFQHAPHSLYVQPWVTTASFDNSVRISTLFSSPTPPY